MMRDNRKDREYYISYLDYQYSRIEKKTEKLQNCDNEKKQRVLISLSGYVIDLLKAEFSFGASKEKIKMLLVEVINKISEYKKLLDEDLMILLSLSIMVDLKNESMVIINANKQTINSDRLLKYLASYIESGKGIWNKNINLSKEYSQLDLIFESSNKENAMISYLDDWYENHSEYAWYNSHLRDEDTYCGYWSFESAAIAKILGLDETKLKTSEYFPTFTSG